MGHPRATRVNRSESDDLRTVTKRASTALSAAQIIDMGAFAPSACGRL